MDVLGDCTNTLLGRRLLDGDEVPFGQFSKKDRVALANAKHDLFIAAKSRGVRQVPNELA